MQLRDELGRLAAAYRAGQRVALLFDYDVALALPVTRPVSAYWPEFPGNLLARLAELPRVGVGVLSDRTTGDHSSLVRLPRLSYVSPRGRESDVKDVRIVHPRSERYRSYLKHVSGALEAVIALFDGAWLEDKTLTLTVHYLAVGDDERPLLQQCLGITLARYAGLLSVVHGAFSAEVLPDVGWAKSDVVRQIVESDGSHMFPFYAAGDRSGGQALRVAADAGGLSVGVGRAASSEAMCYVPEAETLASELAAVCNVLGEYSAPTT